MTDTTNATTDLLSLIEQNTSFSTIGSANNAANGLEFWGACPYENAGHDRFHVYPYAPKPHYWCRSCNKTGDAIDILTHFRNMTYVEACEALGIEPGETLSYSAPMSYDDMPPCKEWQAFARIVIEKAVRYLWSGKADHALSYLLKRGLTEETIRNAELGYVPLINGAWYKRPFADWGLTDEMLTARQKEKDGVRVPNGVLIPWHGDGHIWKLAVKRFEAVGNEMRYGQVVGSKDALYGSDTLARGKPVLLCEGEIDALSAHQEASDLIATIATGSTDKARIPLWIARLASLSSVQLIGFDDDENGAGDKGSKFWIDTLPNAMRWTPYSHDVNDMLREGKDIRGWVELGLQVATSEPTTVALQGVEKPAEPFVCSCCGVDMASDEYALASFYDENEKLFCGSCWKIEDTLVEDIFAGWEKCSACGLPTGRKEPDGLCGFCYMEAQKPTTEPVQPFKIKATA